MSRAYIGDIGTVIRVLTNTNLATAETMKILVKKPAHGELSATEVEWDASIEGAPINGVIFYNIADEDFDRPGKYLIQAQVVFGNGSQFLGNLTSIEVREEWK